MKRKPDREIHQIRTFQIYQERGILEKLEHHPFEEQTRWSGHLADEYMFGNELPKDVGRCVYHHDWNTVRDAQRDLKQVKVLDCGECPRKGNSCPRFGEEWEEKTNHKFLLPNVFPKKIPGM